MSRAAAAMTAAMYMAMTPAGAGAQSGPANVREQVSASFGLAASGRRDAAVSPISFQGRGANGAIGYSRVSGHYALNATIEGTSHGLVPSGTPGPREHVRRAELRMSLLRAVGGISAARGLAIGVDARVHGSVTKHQFDDPGGSAANFALGVASVGPAVAWSQPVGAGTARVELATPALSGVMQSYSDIKTQRPAAAIEMASPLSLRGAMGSLTYEPAELRTIGMVYRYSFAAIRRDDVHPFRILTQSASVGVVTRFGRTSK